MAVYSSIKRCVYGILKYLERYEYYYPSTFLICTISVWLCFTTLFNHPPSFSKNPSQYQVVIKKVRGGGKQSQEEPPIDNLAKKKYFKEMQVKHFPDFESVDVTHYLIYLYSFLILIKSLYII